MINDVFLSQIKKYNPQNINEIKNAMKETLQDIILVGLGKSDFFKYISFYGGTSLRMFRELPRFSEDLDFTFIEDNIDFNFDSYLLGVKKEFNIMKINCEIYSKNKNIETSVISRFIKFNLKDLFNISYFDYSKNIIKDEILTIKVEVETRHIAGAKTEYKLLTYPSFVQVRTFNMETLFASKLIAVLNRKWKARIKGRDFYDYLFYISKNIKVNLIFLENGLKKFGYLRSDEKLSLDKLKESLVNRFNEIDFEEAVKDVVPFVSNDDPFINAFNKDIFISSVDLIK